MKFLQNQSFPKGLALLCGLVLFAGCASAGNPPPLLAQQVTDQEVTVTNYVTATNWTTNVQNQIVPVTVTNEVISTHIETLTNYVVAPGVQTALGFASTAATVTGPLNPFAGATNTALAVLSAGLGLYARFMTKRAQSHASVAQTLVQAIEKSPDATSDIVKGLVKDISQKAGTAQTVHDFVQKITG